MNKKEKLLTVTKLKQDKFVEDKTFMKCNQKTQL